MAKIIWGLALFVAVLVSGLHWIRSVRRGTEPEFAVIFSTFTTAFGLIIGPVLLASSVFDGVRTKLGDLSTYLAIAGFILTLLAVNSVRRAFK